MTLVIERKAKRRLVHSPATATRIATPTFTVKDVIAASVTLEPIICANIACPDPSSGNVVFNQGVGDACCEVCGEWQLDLPTEISGLDNHR
ncbi:hypothetical protein ACOI1H_16350 [Loktanella sp. DJP18]|uniref:hypothetical protein n=1 Tax=Loktanella sp. DJP18 TaxID=3409788 RepID=UPI003BB5360B